MTMQEEEEEARASRWSAFRNRALELRGDILFHRFWGKAIDRFSSWKLLAVSLPSRWNLHLNACLT